jgi:hypothetical protein
LKARYSGKVPSELRHVKKGEVFSFVDQNGLPADPCLMMDKGYVFLDTGDYAETGWWNPVSKN